MLLDHIDKVFHLDIDLFTFVGRISFPLFAFAFAESSHKTIHTKKRLERLLITAFLSEPCYSFSLNINQWIRVKQGTEIKCLSLLSDIGFKNVLFLFLISYLFIIWKRRYQPKCFFQIILFAIALILSEILHTDYGAWGILLIVGLYFCNNKEQSIFLIFESSPNLCVKCIRQILETRKSALDWNGKWPRQGNCLQRQLP